MSAKVTVINSGTKNRIPLVLILKVGNLSAIYDLESHLKAGTYNKSLERTFLNLNEERSIMGGYRVIKINNSVK